MTENTKQANSGKRRLVRLLSAYALLSPILIIPVSANFKIGAVDLLAPLALTVLLTVAGPKLTAPGLWFGSFVVVSGLSTAYALVASTPPTNEPLLLIRAFFIALPFLLVLRCEGIEPTHVKRLFRFFALSGLLACAAGIGLHHAGVQIRSTQQENWYGSGYEATVRAGGLLGNSGDYGHLSALVATLAIAIPVALKFRSKLLVVMFILGSYGTYISSSRAAMLHIAVALIILTPTIVGGRRLPAALIMTPVAGGILWLIIQDLTLDHRTMFVLRRLDIFNLTGDTLFYSSNSRLDSWSLFLNMLQEDLFTGIGYGMSVPLAGRAGDNSFLTVMVETGVPAGLLYLGFWITLVYVIATQSGGRRKAAGLAVTVSEMAHMLTVDTHTMWTTTPISLLFIGCFVRMALDRGRVSAAELTAMAKGGGHVANRNTGRALGQSTRPLV